MAPYIEVDTLITLGSLITILGVVVSYGELVTVYLYMDAGKLVNVKKESTTVDPLMKKLHLGGLQLTNQEKEDLIAFLKTLSDPEFVTE